MITPPLSIATVKMDNHLTIEPEYERFLPSARPSACKVMSKNTIVNAFSISDNHTDYIFSQQQPILCNIYCKTCANISADINSMLLHGYIAAAL